MVPEETLERAAVDDVSPRYLRKQKAAGVKRRRSRPAGSRLRGGVLALLIALGVSTVAGSVVYVFFYSPAVLLHLDGVEIEGEHYVSRDQLLTTFLPDIGKSVLRAPLARRLETIEKIPWVRTATIERVLPNRLIVRIVERTPVAFLSTGEGMKLIDADGVILDKPPGANFNLPVVTGIGEQTPLAERASRVALFAEFLKQIGTIQSYAPSDVIEANLASPDDIKVTLDGLPVLAGQGPVVVQFGSGDFANRFREFLLNFNAWQVRAGNVEAVDLRYDGEALVTPGSPMVTAAAPAAADPPAAQGARGQKNSLASPGKQGKRSIRQ
jgi:cell division protein FtsQ